MSDLIDGNTCDKQVKDRIKPKRLIGWYLSTEIDQSVSIAVCFDELMAEAIVGIERKHVSVFVDREQ